MPQHRRRPVPSRLELHDHATTAGGNVAIIVQSVPSPIRRRHSMTYLVTGAAGFIGYHCCRALLRRGDQVVGVDNLDPYYSVALKRARIAELGGFSGFTFLEID